MKMPDGGFRPAYNVQVAGDPDSQVIVGVAIDTRGCDVGQLRPMLEQLQDRYGRTPSWYLADGGFRQFADIEWAWTNDTAAVIPAQGRDGKDPYAPRPGDGPGVAVWRELMSGALGQRMYRVRSQLECLFAQMRQRDLRQVLVRGSRKVRCVMLLHALAHNLLCGARLRAQAEPYRVYRRPHFLRDWGHHDGSKHLPKYSPEVRERAVRDGVRARRGPCLAVGGDWLYRSEDRLYGGDAAGPGVLQAERDQGKRPGPTTDEQERIKALEREVRELRQANEILRKASAYFAQAELDRPFRK